MVFEVVWTQKAVKSYIANIQYLEKFWSEKESDNFKLLTDNTIKLLKNHPEIGISRTKGSENEVRSLVIHKRVILIYHIHFEKNRIELLLFWNTYQHPARLK